MLDELDEKTLLSLYEYKFNDEKKVDFEELGFENSKHAAFHLHKLKNLAYIRFNEEEAFQQGGMKDEEYNNNVLEIFPEKLEFEEKGIEEVRKYF